MSKLKKVWSFAKIYIHIKIYVYNLNLSIDIKFIQQSKKSEV